MTGVQTCALPISGEKVGDADFGFHGGVTLIVDPRAGRIRYAIRKAVRNDRDTRLELVRRFVAGGGRALGLRDNYFRGDGNPFPHLHLSDE